MSGIKKEGDATTWCSTPEKAGFILSLADSSR